MGVELKSQVGATSENHVFSRFRWKDGGESSLKYQNLCIFKHLYVRIWFFINLEFICLF